MPLASYRTGRNFPLFLVLFFVVWTLRSTLGFHVDAQLPAGHALELYALVSQLLLWITPAILYAVAIRGDSPARSLRLGWPDFSRRGWVTFAIAATTLLLIAWHAAAQQDASMRDLGGALLQHGFGVAFWALPAAAVEGAFFRGLVLTELSERLRFWAANVIAAALFVAIHWPLWLWTRNLDVTFAGDSAGLFVVGVVTGVLTQRTLSIWPGVIWHAAHRCLTQVW